MINIKDYIKQNMIPKRPKNINPKEVSVDTMEYYLYSHAQKDIPKIINLKALTKNYNKYYHLNLSFAKIHLMVLILSNDGKISWTKNGISYSKDQIVQVRKKNIKHNLDMLINHK